MIEDSITQAKQQLRKLELNISHEGERNLERKMLNISAVDDEESDDDFHDAG